MPRLPITIAAQDDDRMRPIIDHRVPEYPMSAVMWFRGFLQGGLPSMRG
jgi:hypothetical protein